MRRWLCVLSAVNGFYLSVLMGTRAEVVYTLFLPAPYSLQVHGVCRVTSNRRFTQNAACRAVTVITCDNFR